MSNPHLCIKKPVRRGSGHDKLNLPVWLVGIPFTLYCRCRCAAPPPAPDRAPLQRAPGQPAVSQKRDRNILTPFCHKYYSGRGETLLGCRCGLMQSVSAACMPTNLSLSLCRFRLWIPALRALRRSAPPRTRTASHTRTGQTHDHALTGCIKDAPSQPPLQWSASGGGREERGRIEGVMLERGGDSEEEGGMGGCACVWCG